MARRTSKRDYLAEERAKLLVRTLAHVPFDGWSAKALAIAATDLGFAPDLVARCYPRGIADVLDAYNHDLDRRMLVRLDEAGIGALKIRERIALAVRTRLELAGEHREAAARAASYYAHPLQASAAAAAVARTVDLMWRAAGDTATDFNYYTKRALLAGVYTTTTAYWLADESADRAATWRFLDRRIEGVMAIQKWRGHAEQLVNGLGERLFRRPMPRGRTR